MGAMFRSEDVILTQVFMQPEAAYEVLAQLGEAGVVQFRDLNESVSAFQRHFVAEVRRADEIQRKLRYIEAEMIKASIPIPDAKVTRAPKTDEINAMENEIDNTERDVREVSQHEASLMTNYNELKELKYVLEKTENVFAEARGLEPFERQEKTTRASHEVGRVDREPLLFLAGVIRNERIPAFERMLWRISRGNAYVRLAALDRPIRNPYTGIKRRMTAFVVFYQGNELNTRINKICVGFHAKLYDCPASQAQREHNLRAVKQRLEDLQLVLKRTKEHREQVLNIAVMYIPEWVMKARKMKAIYHTMNMFNIDVTNKCFIGECWVPTVDLPIVQRALIDGSTAAGSQMPCFLNKVKTIEEPPTYIRTNRFTRGFQNLIDAYGIASYREANPGLYTIVTFPFLFAVMFGDCGHGLIVAMFGAWMCCNERRLLALKSKNEIWNIFFGGRYIIMLMGIFSIYTGVVYNDVFSKSMNVFGSSWKAMGYTTTAVIKESNFPLECESCYAERTPYPLGIDPIWQLSQNKIIFLNSYKMKISIIFGVTHMIFGVCTGVINYNYLKNRSSILLEFLPQLLFLVLLFAYMVFMLIFKWIMYSCQNIEVNYKEGCAPSVLITFIDMMLFKSMEMEGDCDPYMFRGQQLTQHVFVIIALCCIPVMLFGKPLYILRQRKKQKKLELEKRKTRGTSVVNQELGAAGEEKHNEEEEEPFSDIMINQGIYTIEYVLSTISHTASYLRLWALSLAHAELSDVLWNMVLRQGLKTKGLSGAFKLYALFAGWAMGTISILVVMEGLSAFLHTLRLHWVEFMSKFFTGAGYAFKPYSFAAINAMGIQDEDEKDAS